MLICRVQNNSQTSYRMQLRHQPSVKKKDQMRNCIKKDDIGCCGFRSLKRSELSPLNFLKRLGKRIAKALNLWRRPSPQVSSSGRPRQSLIPADAHTSAAIKDCIEFINSSASLPRPNSLPANPC